MMFRVKYPNGNKKDQTIEFTTIEELMSFIMGCDSHVTIKPDWQSKVWEIEIHALLPQ